jgi:valyl-tRNA synthetase
MEKAYDPKLSEEKTYRMWEEGGYFSPEINPKKKPFSIVLPPPNANADLHLGHALYVVEDIMVRYHRMKGEPTLWVSGADHAGFETQYVFEKFLAKQDKSRFDYQRNELYQAIWDFVQNNRGNMENQLRRLGFSLDWTRKSFPLDPEIINTVYKTFKKLHDDKLVYRGSRLVNYCTKCGTGFSDLEVKHVEQKDPLYYMKYGPFVLATVRPETKFGDTAVAVNPNDKRYQKWIGKEIEVEGLLGKFKIIVVADEAIDPEFGTGIAKVTPAHDFTDYEIAKRHNLPSKQVIGFDGKLTKIAGPYAGLRVKAARAKVVEDMLARGLIDHIDENYIHTVATCYKCGSVLEPLPMEQWFIKVKPLTEKASEKINASEIKFVPTRFKKVALRWLTDFHDWNISRQIVWGIQIPAWKCNNLANHPSADTQWIVTDGTIPTECPVCHGHDLTQDPDVFDTWFSSGQWPFATLIQADLKNPEKQELSNFKYFYPTSVMETGYDILPWWVCRMIMLGVYATDQVPFKTVYLHGLVRDAKGQKMSKSKGNVINPLAMIDRYGCDALRMSLIFGTAAGNDQSLSEDKIRGMRNFANKLWNIGRFILMNFEALPQKESSVPFFDLKFLKQLKSPNDIKIITELNNLILNVTKHMDKYRFSDAALEIYDFTWHTIADKYLEENKDRFKSGDIQALAVLRHIFLNILKFLHPFMPFVTEEIWSQMPKKFNKPLIISPWPEK